MSNNKKAGRVLLILLCAALLLLIAVAVIFYGRISNAPETLFDDPPQAESTPELTETPAPTPALTPNAAGVPTPTPLPEWAIKSVMVLFRRWLFFVPMTVRTPASRTR